MPHINRTTGRIAQVLMLDAQTPVAAVSVTSADGTMSLQPIPALAGLSAGSPKWLTETQVIIAAALTPTTYPVVVAPSDGPGAPTVIDPDGAILTVANGLGQAAWWLPVPRARQFVAPDGCVFLSPFLPTAPGASPNPCIGDSFFLTIPDGGPIGVHYFDGAPDDVIPGTATWGNGGCFAQCSGDTVIFSTYNVAPQMWSKARGVWAPNLLPGAGPDTIAIAQDASGKWWYLYYAPAFGAVLHSEDGPQSGYVVSSVSWNFFDMVWFNGAFRCAGAQNTNDSGLAVYDIDPVAHTVRYNGGAPQPIQTVDLTAAPPIATPTLPKINHQFFYNPGNTVPTDVAKYGLYSESDADPVFSDPALFASSRIWSNVEGAGFYPLRPWLTDPARGWDGPVAEIYPTARPGETAAQFTIRCMADPAGAAAEHRAYAIAKVQDLLTKWPAPKQIGVLGPAYTHGNDWPLQFILDVQITLVECMNLSDRCVGLWFWGGGRPDSFPAIQALADVDAQYQAMHAAQGDPLLLPIGVPVGSVSIPPVGPGPTGPPVSMPTDAISDATAQIRKDNQ